LYCKIFRAFFAVSELFYLGLFSVHESLKICLNLFTSKSLIALLIRRVRCPTLTLMYSATRCTYIITFVSTLHCYDCFTVSWETSRRCLCLLARISLAHSEFFVTIANRSRVRLISLFYRAKGLLVVNSV